MKKIIPMVAFLMVLGASIANSATLSNSDSANVEQQDSSQEKNQTNNKSEAEKLVDDLNSQVSFAYEKGDYKKATSLAEQATYTALTKLEKYHLSVAASLNNLALLYEIQGKHELVEDLYFKSLKIFEKNYGKGHPIIATNINNLASFYFRQGKYDKAEAWFTISLVIDETTRGRFHPEVATDLNNLAMLYETQGKHEQAISILLGSLEILEKSLGEYHPNVATVSQNLAGIYYKQRRYEDAESFYLKALEIDEKTHGKEHPDIATTSNNLAILYQEQGKYDKAIDYYVKCLEINQKSFEKDHPYFAITANNLARLYLDQGDYEQAEFLFNKSLTILEKSFGKVHPDIAITLNQLAQLYNIKGKYEQAKPLLEKSLRISNQLLVSWLQSAGEKTRLSYLQQEEYMRNIYLSFYSLHNIPKEAFYFSLSRKSLLLQTSSKANRLAKENKNSDIQEHVGKLKNLNIERANLFFSDNADKYTKIQSLEEESNFQGMLLNARMSNNKLDKIEITLDQVIEKLNNKQTVIDFLVYKEVELQTNKYKVEQVIALIADKQNGIKLIKLGELLPIAKTIETYRAAIIPTETNQNSREKTLTETAKTLYQQLWQPLTPYLENKKTVYLIPDGILHLLPFKALQDPNGKYLAENYQLITLSSARDIVLPPLEGKPSKSAIFAAPDYGNAPAASNTVEANELQTIHFSPLPNALNEGQQIDKLFKKTKVDALPPFLKAQATEQAINGLTAPKILHLSTHGFFLSDIQPDTKALEGTRGLMRSLDNPLPVGKIENPLTRSGLAFANANLGVKGIKQNDGSDGILTALEVLNLNLEGTDLVTLSACDTGVGDIKVGEGVYSLNRAFQEAGAKAVLSTLWSVDDEATSKFMQKFYTRFLDGKPAQTAIQETQQEFMQHEKYRNPYYWAGFVMTGKD